MKTLRYCLIGAAIAGVDDLPCKVIRDLGVEYEEWEAQPIGQQIILRGCSNVPDDLPDFIHVRGDK